jgi:hypothetical protein
LPNVEINEAGGLHAMNVGVHRRRPPKSFDADRVCDELGCETRLSVYNPRQLCWQHEPPRKYNPKVGRTRNSDRLRAPVDAAGPRIPPPTPIQNALASS